MQHLHNHMLGNFSLNAGKQRWRIPQMQTPCGSGMGHQAPPAAWGTRWAPPNTTCLLEILRVVLGGHEDDGLVLGLHHTAEQVEQHGWFVIPTQVEESQLHRNQS